MQPSSLVFVVVIGLWAAYLTQSWMRRREHLQTARSLERYAEAIRVLERRPAIPAAPTRSYAVSPLRARTATSAEPREVSGRPARPVASRASSRLVKVASLAVALVLTLVLGLLAVAGVLPAWTPALGLLLLAADVVVLRQVARRRRPRVELRRARATRPAQGATRVERPAQAAPVVTAAPEVEAVAEPAPLVESVDEPAPVTAPFDVRAFDTPVVEIVAEEPEPLQPGQWRPAPVPLPTYALKASAPRVASVARPVVTAPPVGDDFAPVEVEDDVLVEPVPLRRAVGG